MEKQLCAAACHVEVDPVEHQVALGFRSTCTATELLDIVMIDFVACFFDTLAEAVVLSALLNDRVCIPCFML